MRIFSKIVFICNLCFIAAAVLRIVELGMKKGDAVIPLPVLEGSIVVLGFGLAIILNAIFCVILVFQKILKSPINYSVFILWFNVILFFVQIGYFFFKNKL
jgi:hypothetical protein